MDPFTQRMLERARARQEKIDQKLANTGQTVPKRKPLSENMGINKSASSPVKTPNKIIKEPILSPKRSSMKTESPKQSLSRKSVQKTEQLGVASPQKSRNEVIVTKNEFKSPKRGSLSRRNSVEINIMHSKDIEIEVQVEEREVPINVVYNNSSDNGSTVIVKKINDYTSKDMEKRSIEIAHHKAEKSGLRNNIKSRLDRLGNLYSDDPNLSSPIHRTELEFNSATPPAEGVKVTKPAQREGKKKFGRLAALADQINNWEDDLTHHTANPSKEELTKKSNKPQTKGNLEASTLDVSVHSIQDINKALQYTRKDMPNNKKEELTKKSNKSQIRKENLEASTLDVSVHSIQDINKALQYTRKDMPNNKNSKPVNSGTFSKPSANDYQRLDRKIVAQLEGEGYRRVSAGQSRLVYDFTATENTDPNRQEPSHESTTPSATAAPKMATMVASAPPANPAIVSKKPSLKKYKAPTPPQLIDDEICESNTDKENTMQKEENDSINQDNYIETKPATANDKPGNISPLAKRVAPKLNSNERSSVLSKAALFESGSPKAKDPAEMSLRERKAFFEKNKGAAIVPKAPFGQAPSVKALHGYKADVKPVRPVVQPVAQQISKTTTPTNSNRNSKNNSRRNSKESLPEDNTSQSSLGGGIKGKLAALFNKEQTISETTIANKFKQERDKEMAMLQNRFHKTPGQPSTEAHHDSSEDENDEHNPSEKAPLMGSTMSLSQGPRKPEVVSNVPKITFDKTRSETVLNANEEDIETDVIGSQPIKKRSSQDSQVSLTVYEEIKRIKMNKRETETNGATPKQPRLYPHLSDIETDTSHTQEEYSDECGNSSTDNISDNEIIKPKDNLNKSDNWAETSFGREIMNVVRKNNTSYKKAVRDSDSTDESESTCNSELDNMLDEALNEESEGPTPPKVKSGGLSSASFVYQERAQFKSPLKNTQLTPARTPRDTGSELVHSVSFYRRMQHTSSTPSTPIRVIKHTPPDSDIPSTPDEPTVNVTTVRQRVKELQVEISKQQTVISQASQALNLCAATIEFSDSTEQAEGERLLLLATHRRQACLHEVQRLQVEGAGVAATAGMASLHLTSLSVPLRRDYVRQLNADGAVGHHMVLLVKCRDRMLASSMQQTQPSNTHVTFLDEIRMDGLASDFKVTVEVYMLQASKEVLPHDVKYHIFNKKSNSKLLTPKSKVCELKTPRVQSPAGPHAVRTPQFALHGYCIFALQQANRKSFTLNKVPAGSPLEGSVNMCISAVLRVPAPAPHAAFLTAFDDVSGLGAWHRRWFRLQAPRLQYWKYPDDVQKKLPIGDIDLKTVLSDKATKAPRDLCARPNTILLEASVPAGLVVPDRGSLVYVQRSDGTIVRRHLLAADTQQDRDMWLDRLNQALEYVRCSCTDDE